MSGFIKDWYEFKKTAREDGEKVHRFLIASEAFKSCLNCDHWDAKVEQCKKYNARPPAETIVFSCGNAWEAFIPF